MTKDLLSRLADEILANPLFGQALSGAMQKALETKGRVDRNVEALLGLLNLPSRGDLRRIQTKLDVVQGTLTNLSMKVDRLLAAERAERKDPAGRDL